MNKAGIKKVDVKPCEPITIDFKLSPSAGDDEDEFTDLYANYPNPFNPDTWIPYSLSPDSDVTIRIFNSAGHLVRTLPCFRRANGYTVITFWVKRRLKLYDSQLVGGDIWFNAVVSPDIIGYGNTTGDIASSWLRGEKEAFKVDVAPIPEPTTFLLLGQAYADCLALASDAIKGNRIKPGL
ncbi:hypothetical protein FJZ31_18265 [Candidatus Poribacteria bacterium]|nr:hypothetical protein [Candidatus Poribacteria bacterium]